MNYITAKKKKKKIKNKGYVDFNKVKIVII